MGVAMTLRELITAHPEWQDLPIAVLNEDGDYDFLDATASAWKDAVTTAKSDTDPTPTLLDILVMGAL
jgi:hypothetical protein